MSGFLATDTPGWLSTLKDVVGLFGVPALVTLVVLAVARMRLFSFFRFSRSAALELVFNGRARADREGSALEDYWSASLGGLSAATIWANKVGVLSRRKPIQLNLSTQPVSTVDRDLVILGGNGEGELCDRFIKQLRRSVPEAGFLYDDRLESDNILSLGSMSASYDWIGEAKNCPPSHDYGVIVAWVNPFTLGRRRAFFCAGFTSVGSYHVTRHLFDELLPHRRYRRLARAPASPPFRRGGWPCFILCLEMTFSPAAQTPEFDYWPLYVLPSRPRL